MKRKKTIPMVITGLVLVLCGTLMIFYGKSTHEKKEAAAKAAEEEAAFVAAAEAFEDSKSIFYAQFQTLDEMIAGAHVNRIVRCKVTERRDCMMYDPYGLYDVAQLDSVHTQLNAEQRIATPYTLEIKENYLGDLGDTTTFYAEYGQIGTHTYRHDKYPVLEVGKEYILFLRMTEINGAAVTYLAIPPLGAVELDGDTVVPGGYGTLLYAPYPTVADLETALRTLVAENNYPTEIEVREINR